MTDAEINAKVRRKGKGEKGVRRHRPNRKEKKNEPVEQEKTPDGEEREDKDGRRG